jgi:hypothetical protein
MPRQKSDKGSETFRLMIHNYLQNSSQTNVPLVSSRAAAAASRHLDEDALAAFVEGRLGEQESAPFIAHVIGCAACRRISARLVRLQTEIEGETTLPASLSEEPGRFRRMLDDLASRISPESHGDAVFAYHAPADDFDDTVRKAKKTESETSDAAQKDSLDEEDR